MVHQYVRSTCGLFLIVALVTISISQNFFAQAEMIMLMIAIEENTRTVAQYVNTAATRRPSAPPASAQPLAPSPVTLTPAPTPTTNPSPWPFFPS
jgi:hypothetical protein